MARTRAPARELEIPEDAAFQARESIAQRIGWGVLAALLLAAVLGAFGEGLLSRSRAGSGATFWLEYARFARYGAPTTMTVHLTRGAAPLAVRLQRGFVDSVRIDSITPPPLRVSAEGEWMTFEFAASAPADIRFDLVPRRLGWSSGRLQVGGDGSTPAFAHFVYP